MFTTKSLILSICLSLFIYLEYFNISSYILNTILALFGFYLLFSINKKELFGSGFILGILWFWWIGYSFVYYDLIYLVPLVILGIGLLYGLLFYFIGLFNNLLYKILYIFTVSFINPFEFNWFKFELPFINSYIGSSKLDFAIVLLSTATLVYFQSKNKFKLGIAIYAISILFIAIFYKANLSIPPSNLNIYENNTNIAQENRWNPKYKTIILDDNFKSINKAIGMKKDLIVFPETAFPIILNYDEQTLTKLLKHSYSIPIILGSLYKKEGLLYNSSYLFQNGTVQVANKVVLVPFGEAVPLPEKLRDIINNTFYNGAKDYETAENPTTFHIKGEKFRNAICYEATTDAIYKELDTQYVIAISNNAWFTPSIQPTLQKLLMKYYSFKYNVYIYSISNQ